MAQFRPEHFSGTVRTTKDDLRFGPLKERRVNTIPPDTFGRNGDLVIVDDTAITSQDTAVTTVPVDVGWCQKIPIPVTAGDFTVTATSGVYTIDISTLDDFVDAINAAAIPELRAAFTDPKTPSGGVNYLLHCNSVTFADGTSDIISALGLTGLQTGDVTVATGTWQCFPVGSTGIDVESSGVPVAPGGFDTLNFTGPGVSSIVDSGGGTVTITISGGGAGGVAYGAIAGDVGTAIATAASELVTFGGIGITITATDAGAGLDSVSFDLDIADLPAGAGPVVLASTIAINVGGTTEEYPLSTLSSLFLGTAYSRIAGGDGGLAIAIGSDTITVNGTGINVTATDAGAGLDTLDLVMDIADLAAGAGPLISSDEIAVDDGGTTERHSIEDVVDAALPGVRVTTIDGQLIPTIIDTTRANKVLSIATEAWQFNENVLTDLDWIRIGNASDATTGYIANFDGTVVGVSAHCATTGANSKDIHLFADGVDKGSIGTLSGGANATFRDNTLDIDISQDERIRLQAVGAGTGQIEDTVVKLTIRWRA